MTSLPSLNGLRAFEAAARHLSFTRAAAELNVTQTAISHQIRRLEDELGWSAQERASVESLSDRVLQAARPWPRGRKRGLQALAAAAFVLLAIGVYAWLRPAQTPDGGSPAEPGQPIELATAVKLEGVRWEPENGLQPAEGGVVTAGRLRLRAGRLTLAFYNGVLLTLEGPADLELEVRQVQLLDQHCRVPLHLVADPPHGCVQAQAAFHAHHQQVQRVGQGQEDLLLPLGPEPPQG